MSHLSWQRGAGPGAIAVVVDILRAASTITTALALGASGVWVRTDVDAARDLAATLDALLVGERKNVPLPGFDYGNSPADFADMHFAGRQIVLTSTNFPLALEASLAADAILVDSLLNLTSTLDYAYTRALLASDRIGIILAGEPSEPEAREDLHFGVVACGALQDRCSLGNKARQALGEFESVKAAQAVGESLHAQELKAKGFGRDVAFVQTVDRFDVVALWDGQRFVASPTGGSAV